MGKISQCIINSNVYKDIIHVNIAITENETPKAVTKLTYMEISMVKQQQLCLITFHKTHQWKENKSFK